MLRLKSLLPCLAAAAIAILALFAAPVLAQLADDPNRPSRERYLWNKPKDKYEPNKPGQFDYYAFVLSWSPTHCSGDAGADDDQQCNRRDGKRFNFIVHGLWPQYDKGWPQNCVPRGSSYIPQKLIDDMMDIMPSKRLIIHEFRKHGTCSGLAPFAYFDMIRQQFKAIVIPKRYVNPFETMFVSPADVVDDFMASNPQLELDMIAVSCGGPGNRLKEVRICLAKDGQPAACRSNEVQRKLCSAPKMFIPPVRSTKLQEPNVSIENRPPQQQPNQQPKSQWQYSR